MALENPTKSNYGNVDDITPTEANNIGLNLDALGQKIQKVVDDVWITTNADYDGVNWNRIDTAKAAAAQQIGVDSSVTHYNVVAGANPISWVQKFKVDAAGNIVTGNISASKLTTGTMPNGVIVPLARVLRTEVSAKNTSAITIGPGVFLISIDLGTVNSGDRILVYAGMFVVLGTIAGVLSFYVTRGGTSSAQGVFLDNGGSANSNTIVDTGPINFINQSLSSIFKVTSTGSLNLQLFAASFGSDSQANIGNINLYGLVLNNG